MINFCVEFTDGRGVTSPIDNITAPEDYTAAQYIADCLKNADDDWNEMLSSGTVSIVPVEG